jgi:hypothetical protein
LFNPRSKETTMNVCKIRSRRDALVLLACAAFTGVASAAGLGDLLARVTGHSKPSCLSVVLVDVTSSVQAPDWALYERAFEKLLASGRPGDRVVMATVADRPASKFIAAVDRSYPATGRSLEDEIKARHTQEALRKDFAELRSASARNARATRLIDAMGATAELFAQARHSGQTMRLLVLSDMIEESTLANFARKAPDEASTQRLLAARRAAGLIPDLHSVSVQVVGASGPSAEHMARIRSFWVAFFTATGASLDLYGRTVGV